MKYTYAELAKMIDHSLLHPTLTDAQVFDGLAVARRSECATACVKPYAVPAAVVALLGSGVGVCAVVGFPHGNSHIAIKVTEADRATLVEQVCYGSYGARELKDKPVMPALRDWLRPEQLAVLDDYLPEKLVMGNNRKARLTYHKEGPPVLSARIQELFGVDGRFTIGHGRVAVKFEVLAPNHRAIQVTDDLTSFWRDMYPKVKAELSRRYPRHEWR